MPKSRTSYTSRSGFMDDRWVAALRLGGLTLCLCLASGAAAQTPADAATEAGSLVDEIPEWIGPLAPVDTAERAAREFARRHPYVDDVFDLGEHLSFSVRYGPIRAGQATMTIRGIEVIDGDSCYHVVTTAGSNDFFSTFFHVRDRVESFMDMATLLPRRFEKHLQEGGYASTEIVHFDHGNQIAVYQGFAGEADEIVELWPSCHDILSAFYAVRTRDFDPGEAFFLDSHTSKRNYPLKVIAHRRERVDVPAGAFDCLVVEPVLRTPGLFKHEGELRIWLTDDRRKIPVQMKSALPIGSISVVLLEVAGRTDWVPQR
ncbi:MAG: DUF3108 domain-containing protein [Candidatus Eisenbacteria bacterium]|nr:DUF3108 domain-containing protein [Candidatus Eisenbacteria bacterium]